LDPSKLKSDLRSVLDAPHVPVESQIAVFSKTSLQAPLIEPNNPRTIFFNLSVAVGWMKGGFIELAALDPRQGVQFYTLQPRGDAPARFEKGRDCLRCHVGEAWFVTGSVGTVRHLGNAVIGPHGDPKAMELLHGKADSDVAALTVFDHQMHMANLITRIGWDARADVGRLEDEAREFVDYLLFVDEPAGHKGCLTTILPRGPIN
jgi:hypothetical protein